MAEVPDCDRVDLVAYSRWARHRRRLAQATVRTYMVWLADGERHLHRTGDCLARAGSEILESYLDHLVPTAASRNSAIAALRSYYEFASRVGELAPEDNPARQLDFWAPRKRLPKPLEHEQIGPYLAEAYQDSPMLGTFSVFALGTSLRLEEIRVRSRAAVTGRRMFLRQKGGTERVVVLSSEVQQALREWLRAAPESTWLWPSPRNPQVPVSADWIYRHVREAGANAGIDHMHPHRLRHTGITAFYRLTRDPLATQRYAGHANFGTTRRYIEVSTDETDPYVDQLRFRPRR